MRITQFFASSRTHRFLGLFASAVLAINSGAFAAVPGETVKVDTGAIQGKADADTIVYHAIPYAAPPVGPLRWKPPQPPKAWSGVRDATKTLTPCAQTGGEVEGGSTNEDCLYLDVTVPRAKNAAGPKPVMVWLHGGGLSTGTINTYDMRRMAVQGDVILVAIESRLNIFGYFAYPGIKGSGGFGFLDEQAGLKWVKRNIAKFGGDPNNVTLFGESGGAVRTCAHITAPGSAGLFNKVILQSGNCAISWPRGGVELPYASFFQPVAEMQARGADLAEKLGCKGPRGSAEVLACLRELPAEKLLPENDVFMAASYGNSVLPEEPAKALRTGHYNVTPVLSGWTRDENRILVSLMQLTGNPMTNERFAAELPKAFGDHTKEVEARYPLSRYESAATAWAAIMTDRMFVCTQLPVTKRLAKKAPVFAYEFADPHGIGLVPFPANIPSGASHSSELPLLFDLTNNNPIDWDTKKPIRLSAAQTELAAKMIGYWTRFARTGQPGDGSTQPWSKIDPNATAPYVMALAPGPNGIAPVDSYAKHQCAFWEPVIG